MVIRTHKQAAASLRRLDAALRRPAWRLLDRLVGSPRIPFGVRSRLLWRQQQGTWLAHRPETFTEKLRWRMLKDRRPLLTTFADKVAVRDYVARLAGPECLTECYAVVDDPDELDRASLPREFVLKASHGSGGAWIVSDAAPSEPLVSPGEPYAPGPVTPLSGWHWILTTPGGLDWDVLVASSREWLSRSPCDRHPEWAYLHVPPRILVEELLCGPDGQVPADYKFFVFDGHARLVQVDSGRFRDHRRNLYLPDWTPVDTEYVYRRADEFPRPPSLGRMVELAEALGRGMDFLRVDLYEIEERVVFGELTNYPEGGTAQFEPVSFDAELGRWWTLPASYR
jgi:hypothetical protein